MVLLRRAGFVVVVSAIACGGAVLSSGEDAGGGSGSGTGRATSTGPGSPTPASSNTETPPTSGSASSGGTPSSTGSGTGSSVTSATNATSDAGGSVDAGVTCYAAPTTLYPEDGGVGVFCPFSAPPGGPNIHCAIGQHCCVPPSPQTWSPPARRQHRPAL